MVKQGRHPILEKLMKDPFIANDVFISEANNFQIITGPNMVSKSQSECDATLTHAHRKTIEWKIDLHSPSGHADDHGPNWFTDPGRVRLFPPG